MSEYKNKIYKVTNGTPPNPSVRSIFIVTPEDKWYRYHDDIQIWKLISASLRDAIKNWNVREINHLQLLVETQTSRMQAEKIHHYASRSANV